MGNITMKSTKQEIMDAYLAAKKTLDEQASMKDDPVATAKAEQEAQIIVSAEVTVNEDILNPAIIEKYKKLNAAIELKTKELNNLYGIESEANSLVAIINAHKDKVSEIETNYKQKTELLQKEYNQKKAELDEDIANLKLEKQNILDSINTEANEARAEVAKKRAREEEEYTYNRDRQRQIEENEWNDKKEEEEKELEKRVAEVTKREEALTDQSDYIIELEGKVNSSPTLVEDAKAEGVKQGKADADKSNAFEVRALKKENEYNTNLLNDKIERLTSDLENVKSEKADLQARLDDAYTRMNELAMKTTEATGGVKILNSTSNQAGK